MGEGLASQFLLLRLGETLISNQQLATLRIRRVIFHDIPRRLRGGGGEPVLSDVETKVDETRRSRLRIKLTRVLGSKQAYPVCFDPNSASPVPSQVRLSTKRHCTAKRFVAMSQKFAKYLFEQQHGAMSPGLLCVLDAATGGRPCVILMKLEREVGAQVELIKRGGKKTFAMSVLDNLVLTDGTRLFKSAMFLREGSGDDDFSATLCDDQLNVTSSDDIARFWVRFLGCTFVVEPRVATERFYESTLRFINEVITDPIQKNDLYEHLHSQLKSARKIFSPRSFIEEHVPSDFHKSFREHLKSEGVSLASFAKDLSDIETRLRRCAYRTTQGGLVSMPADKAELVEIKEKQIIVNDTLLAVDRK